LYAIEAPSIFTYKTVLRSPHLSLTFKALLQRCSVLMTIPTRKYRLTFRRHILPQELTEQILHGVDTDETGFLSW
jgi:hypothetical protein